MRRVVVGTLAAVGWWMVSCRDVPAPESGVFAVGPLRLPSPGLVAGDTMRDSTGLVAPLTVVAYGADGEPFASPPAASFVVLDTTAHTAGALLIGDLTGNARVVGTVAGIQTRQVQVKVTLRPDTLTTVDSVRHGVTYALTGADTVVNSAPLNVDIEHVGAAGAPPTGVEAVIVKYLIDRSPAGTAEPTVQLMNGNVASDRDTTDASGRASRVLRLRLLVLGASATDSALVTATASHRGRVLGALQFRIVYTRQ